MECAVNGIAHAHHGHIEVMIDMRILWAVLHSAGSISESFKIVHHHPAQNEAMMNLILQAQVEMFEEDVLHSQMTSICLKSEQKYTRATHQSECRSCREASALGAEPWF
jgi:hypothetical protein